MKKMTKKIQENTREDAFVKASGLIGGYDMIYQDEKKRFFYSSTKKDFICRYENKNEYDVFLYDEKGDHLVIEFIYPDEEEMIKKFQHDTLA